MAASASRPVDSSPRPSRSTAFSLKIGSGFRVAPSKTTNRTELEPTSTTAKRGGLLAAEKGTASVLQKAVRRSAGAQRGNDGGPVQGRAAPRERGVGHEIFMSGKGLSPGAEPLPTAIGHQLPGLHRIFQVR